MYVFINHLFNTLQTLNKIFRDHFMYLSICLSTLIKFLLTTLIHYSYDKRKENTGKCTKVLFYLNYFI